MQSAIVGHSSVSGGMVQRLCFAVSGCVFVIVCSSIAGRPLSRDRRQFTKAESPASLLKTYFLTVVVDCRGGSLRGRRVRSANTYWASWRGADGEARRAEKKRDRAAAHDADVRAACWQPGRGLEAVDQASETAEIRFEQAPPVTWPLVCSAEDRPQQYGGPILDVRRCPPLPNSGWWRRAPFQRLAAPASPI